MSAPPTQAAERTLLARVRTAVALVLTCAIVARAVSSAPAAITCLVVAVAAVVTLRTRTPVSHLVLAGCVIALAVVGLLGT
ncbi:hypothetical protein [Tsukamurella ocularis]|uniref:hypothetical protein n=1 Tax=Tsukamurella ocularis TaxID=1970234 RepID=UPI00216801A6|nr:hypothetical protein [Tsukamurella ocularis]MCS3781344.1 uncharacterized membrane protein YidH (DUF202 family) [Tsukamurella ocularis]MCS3787715.1 uncharacterized membrane protein YidH (DUF202 family) [Tsukamurella ocularis]MCS3851010.1 uncharacterized membrane protein YidH (DUF202 family) [Tsukamurella ocularis]